MKKQMILLLLFLLLSLTAFCAHAEIMDCFPEEKAANSAYHLRLCASLRSLRLTASPRLALPRRVTPLKI